MEIPDRTDATIKYPSVEAAVASAKYQIASGLKEKGPQLFRVEGTIHQSFNRERERAQAEGRTAEMIDLITDNQVTATRVEATPNRIQKTYKSTWDNDAWLAAREGVYRDYIKRRYDADARFRQMIQAIRAVNGEILFANGKEANALGVGVLDDGTVIGGDNMIGKIMMSLE